MFDYLRFSKAARADLLHIRLESARLFGREQAIVYTALLRRALEDNDAEPMRPDIQRRPELGEGDRHELTARHVVITAPVPQMVEMSPELTEAAGEGAAEAYDKAIVGLFRFEDDRGLPETCLLEEPAAGIGRVILESAKYPGRPPSASVRCDAGASDFLWEKGDDEIWDWMAGRLGDEPPFGTAIADRQVKRWRLSEAADPVDAPFLTVGAGSSTISACGDGFTAGGPTGVENALCSAQALFDSGPWRY